MAPRTITAYQARLKPLDPARGHHLQGLTISSLRGQRYVQGHWYRVSAEEAEVLRCVHQNGDTLPPGTELADREQAFDVCTTAEAEQLSAREHRAAVLQEPLSQELQDAPERDDPSDEPKPAGRRVGARK